MEIKITDYEISAEIISAKLEAERTRSTIEHVLAYRAVYERSRVESVLGAIRQINLNHMIYAECTTFNGRK